MAETKEFLLKSITEKQTIKVTAERVGNNWKAICPKHDDTNPSLSINEEKGLFNCFGFGCGFKGKVIIRKKAIKFYNYNLENKNLYYQVVRYEPKDFKFRRPDEYGNWIYNLNGLKQIPYRLPELTYSPADSVILWCEGEKDADNVAEIGFISTTLHFGKIWDTDINKYFKDRRIILLLDNDDSGRKYSTQIGKNLTGVAKEIKWLELPGLQEKEDVSDWIEKGGNAETLKELIAGANRFEEINTEEARAVEVINIIKEENNAYHILKTYDSFREYKKISNFTIEIVSKLDYGTHIERSVRFNSDRGKKDLFILKSDNMPDARSFKKFCLSKGDLVFEGTDKDLNEIWKYEFGKNTNDEISMADGVGYLKQFNAWIFSNLAIIDNKIIRTDKNNIFRIGEREGIKILPFGSDIKLPGLKIPENSYEIGKNLNSAELLFNKNLGGFKGSLIISYIVATIYSFDFYKEYKFFPILYAYGKYSSGKNTVCGYIMSFFGFNDESAAKNAQETTQTAISRYLQYFSFIPFWLDEYKPQDKHIKLSEGFLKDVYNKAGSVKALRAESGVREVKVRDNLILSGEYMPNDTALRSRCFPLTLSEKDRDDSVYNEIVNLSKDFSKITAYLLLNKNPGIVSNYFRIFENLKQKYRISGLDSRQSEIYAAFSAARVLINDISPVPEGFLNWVKVQAGNETSRRDEESLLVTFFETVEGLKARGEIQTGHHILIEEEKIYLWFAEIFRICEKEYRQRRYESMPSKQTILDQISEEDYFLNKNHPKRISGIPRNCLVLDLNKCPQTIKNLVEGLI